MCVKSLICNLADHFKLAQKLLKPTLLLNYEYQKGIIEKKIQHTDPSERKSGLVKITSNFRQSYVTMEMRFLVEKNQFCRSRIASGERFHNWPHSIDFIREDWGWCWCWCWCRRGTFFLHSVEQSLPDQKGEWWLDQSWSGEMYA